MGTVNILVDSYMILANIPYVIGNGFYCALDRALCSMVIATVFVASKNIWKYDIIILYDMYHSS